MVYLVCDIVNDNNFMSFFVIIGSDCLKLFLVCCVLLEKIIDYYICYNNL